MIEPPLPRHSLVQHWLERHPNPASFILHMIGIPPTILGVLFVPVYLSLMSLPVFFVALALFVGGYLLQFAGHLIEGTDPGEIIYFKRKLGLPYVEFPELRASRGTRGYTSARSKVRHPQSRERGRLGALARASDPRCQIRNGCVKAAIGTNS